MKRYQKGFIDPDYDDPNAFNGDAHKRRTLVQLSVVTAVIGILSVAAGALIVHFTGSCK